MRRCITAVLAILMLASCSSDSPAPKATPETPAAPSKPVASATPIEIVTEPVGDWLESACSLPIEYIERIRRGYVKGRSPEILFVPREPNFFGGFTSTTHSGPWDYVQNVPIAFYGPGFIKSEGKIELDREVTLADIAPTLADLLDSDFPSDRPGRAITEALVPKDERPGKPRMILVVVWDGGGWDVLDTWPNAWPFLDGLMKDGTTVMNAIVGSSPSVTPAVHATIGTGTFPKDHGIVDIPIRMGDDIVGAYDGRTGQYMEATTLADIYDQETDNKAKIGMLAYKSWHLGMIGKGAQLPGGDRDIAIIAEKSAGDLVANETYYELPAYLQEVGGFEDDRRSVDLEDGKLDDKWMGHEVLKDPSELRHTPVWSLYQTRLLKEVFGREGFGQDNVTDLFYTNYKQVDDVGHDWNMLNPEMREILRYSDDQLAELVDYLDREVGKEKWVVAFTADHGQSPDPMAAQAWPVRIQLLQDDISKEFDHTDNDVDLFQDERPVGFWLDAAEMEANGVTEEDISNYLVDYRLEQNIRPGEKIPDQYRDRLREPILAAGFPSDEMGKIWSCAKRRA